MSNAELQQWVIDWAKSRRFTAPYGVLSGQATNKMGRKYRSVTFGFARTHDFEVAIYGSSFILLRDSSNRNNNQVFKSVQDLIDYMDKRFF
jgi:hypothetical protein